MKTYISLLLIIAILSGCSSTGVFEKNIAIPEHEWKSSFRPEIKLNITDTVALYRVFIIVRHTNAYDYNNLWANLYRRSGSDSFPPLRLNLQLATNEKGWLGSGMDDIFEHRVLITPPEGIRLRSGEQWFRIEHLMREDPLPNVMNVGVRMERAGQ